MIIDNSLKELKENDLFHVTWGWKGSKYQQLKSQGFAIICFIIYHSKHHKITTSAGILMKMLKHINRTAYIQENLTRMKYNRFIDCADDFWYVKKNQIVDISIKKSKSQSTIDLLKHISVNIFYSLINLSFKHWSVYCYLFTKYYSQEDEYFACSGHEIQEALCINRNTVKNIIIDLEIDGFIEVKRQSGATREGFGRFAPNLYKVL